MLISLTLGSILLLVTLGKYIHTRRQFLSWNVQYGNSTNSSGFQGSNPSIGRRNTIYDQWLMVRFTIAFIVLGIFEMTTILFQVVSMDNSSSLESLGSSPDLSVERAKLDFMLFIPGVSASLLTFVVFGTTKPFRETLKRTFIPRWLIKDKKSDRQTLPPFASQNRKQSHTAQSNGDDYMYSPTEDGRSVIRLQEIHQHDSRKYSEEDEWPILERPTRVNRSDV